MVSSKDKTTIRFDLGLPKELYDKITQIAIENDAPINLRTGNTVLTPTIVTLIRLGIKYCQDKGYSTSELDKIALQSTIIEVLDSVLESKVQSILAKHKNI